jgi:hypothetical protein
MGPLEETANKNFGIVQNPVTDRTNAVPFPVETVEAAFDVHKTVFTAVKRRKGQGFYQFTVV